MVIAENGKYYALFDIGELLNIVGVKQNEIKSLKIQIYQILFFVSLFKISFPFSSKVNSFERVAA
jgi:hypothetical protein